MSLRLDYCSHQAAKHAVMRWHYSRAMPAAKLVKIGVWEDEKFRGAVIYGSGANRHLARPFGLGSSEACELVRVALAPGRRYPTSKCLAFSLKMVKRQSPGLKVVVSYADRKEGHVGTIYQATHWIYLGASTQPYIRLQGRIVHPRSLHARYGRGGQSVSWLRDNIDPHAQRVAMPAKLKYVWAFDRPLRERLKAQSQPYPKKSDFQSTGSVDGDASGCQPEEGGSIPTPVLQSHREE